MKIGIIKEGKVPSDERVPMSPEQCAEVKTTFPNVELVVQKSNVRRFKDEEYANVGITLVESVDDCDVLMGVKEVPIKELIANKTYFYFSHTIKKQPYNRALLLEMIKKNIKMVDYETITDVEGRRLIGFGRYAGVVGCYNSFFAYGKREKAFDLKRAYLCDDRKEMEAELKKVKLPIDYKIVITGGGRVAGGIIEILDVIGIKKVTPDEFLNQSFNEPVYTQLNVHDYNKRKDGKEFDSSDFFNHPTEFEGNFFRFAKVTDMYISGHFWDEEAPFIFSREEAKSPEFNIKVVGDISCDIDGPVACTLRPSTIKEPLYGYDPQQEKEVIFDNVDAITVMAVDNLPCELPKDASADFGREFIDNVLPHLIDDKLNIIKNATICENGDLTETYEYLRDYVEGE
ncbi:MAG TPA: NAD(P)-dependent oxidoreductase [Vicingaceae bacterium]